MQIHKKEGETAGSLLYRFNKKMQQTGILKEAKKRRFRGRPLNRRKRRLRALYRAEKITQFKRAKKLGI